MIVKGDRINDVLLQHGFNLTKATSTSTRSPGCCGVHSTQSINDGRANLPVCPNLTASKRSNAGETMWIRTQEHHSARSGGIWAARQRRPTLVVVPRCIPCCGGKAVGN
jgi:hypothetical protein